MTSRTRLRLRFRFQPRQVLVLTAVWLALVGQVNLVTVVGGFLISWAVTVVFPLQPIHYYGRPRLLGMLLLGLALVRDLAVASVRLAAYAFTRRPITPGIVRVDLRGRTDLYQVNVAQLVSIVPGTLVVDARRRGRLLYLHAFDLDSQDAAGQVVADTLRVERRLLRAFGSASEIEAAEAGERPPDGSGGARP